MTDASAGSTSIPSITDSISAATRLNLRRIMLFHGQRLRRKSYLTRGPVNASPASVIPRNELGIPIFPCVDLDSATPVTLRQVLREYFTECWMLVRDAAIPWADLLANPIAFYDTERFSSPVAIQDTGTMSNIDTLTISQFLLKHSSDLADKTFRFFAKERGPQTPPTPEENALPAPTRPEPSGCSAVTVVTQETPDTNRKDRPGDDRDSSVPIG
ncbi:hypothetical protein B0H14DRAFT_2561787 [Mycena olivaceomarginata]|nr:hypothetical protein B0H14DRAFT_2561787 [Mycena olivaceomarginata]